MKILGIETSCDETAVAVIEVAPRPIRPSIRVISLSNQQAQSEEITVLSNMISSQVKLHARYGGVVPNLAAREHVKNIEHVFRLALKEADIKDFNKEVDLITVTRGPGLGPSLLVGIAFARTLAWKHNKPLVGVNHLEGHIYSNWLKSIARVANKLSAIDRRFFPVLNLIVSGGHTELVLMTEHGKYKIIGETLDDAVGEAFDKVGRLLGFDYPGGPAISARAEKFSTSNFQLLKEGEIPEIKFPRPMIKTKTFDFSYAGLKTAVLYKVRDLENAGIKLNNDVIDQICYEFQKAALDVLVFKTMKAVQEYRVKSLFLSGGVSANKELRNRLETEAKKIKVYYSQPEMEYTGDNAAMIAVAGYFNYKKCPPSHKVSRGIADVFNWQSVEMDANLDIT